MNPRRDVCSGAECDFFDAFAHSLFDMFNALGLLEAVFVEGVEHVWDRDHMADVYYRRRSREIHRHKDAAP